jgi:hypothetical protein
VNSSRLFALIESRHQLRRLVRLNYVPVEFVQNLTSSLLFVAGVALSFSHFGFSSRLI